MKRKILAALLASTMVLSLVGCGGGSGDTPAAPAADSYGGSSRSGGSSCGRCRGTRSRCGSRRRRDIDRMVLGSGI